MKSLAATFYFDTPEELAEFLAQVTTEGDSDVAETEGDRAHLADAATRAVVAEPVITDTADKDGMPYNDAYHATPKSQTADGLWRAKRGKSTEANNARAAFKAAGGAVTAPVVAAAVAMPVVAAAAAAPVGMPGMPGMPAAAARAPEPISYDKLIDKTVGMMQRAKIDSDGVMRLYGAIGLVDPAVLETNESMRAALYSKLAEIEPDLA